LCCILSGVLNRRVLKMRPREKLFTRIRGKWGSSHVKERCTALPREGLAFDITFRYVT
jgi:hypothetical protein